MKLKNKIIQWWNDPERTRPLGHGTEPTCKRPKLFYLGKDGCNEKYIHTCNYNENGPILRG